MKPSGFGNSSAPEAEEALPAVARVAAGSAGEVAVGSAGQVAAVGAAIRLS